MCRRLISFTFQYWWCSYLLVHYIIVALEQSLHAVDFVAHLLPLRLRFLVVEMLLHQRMVLFIE